MFLLKGGFYRRMLSRNEDLKIRRSAYQKALKGEISMCITEEEIKQRIKDINKELRRKS